MTETMNTALAKHSPSLARELKAKTAETVEATKNISGYIT
jgi:hypothetical protein